MLSDETHAGHVYLVSKISFNTFDGFHGVTAWPKQKNKVKQTRRLQNEALELLKDPSFLFRVSEEIEALGVVGEKRNRLILFLAMLTAQLTRPSVWSRGQVPAASRT